MCTDEICSIVWAIFIALYATAREDFYCVPSIGVIVTWRHPGVVYSRYFPYFLHYFACFSKRRFQNFIRNTYYTFRKSSSKLMYISRLLSPLILLLGASVHLGELLLGLTEGKNQEMHMYVNIMKPCTKLTFINTIS